MAFHAYLFFSGNCREAMTKYQEVFGGQLETLWIRLVSLSAPTWPEVRGALISALLVGLVDTFGKVLLPQVSGMLVYVLMAAVLLWKPEGLFKQ